MLIGDAVSSCLLPGVCSSRQGSSRWVCTRVLGWGWMGGTGREEERPMLGDDEYCGSCLTARVDVCVCMCVFVFACVCVCVDRQLVLQAVHEREADAGDR